MLFTFWLRHSVALLLAAGVHPKVVQQRLGHSQIGITLDTLSHVVPTLPREAAGKFDTLMRPISKNGQAHTGPRADSAATPVC
jgi:hypothetical protein